MASVLEDALALAEYGFPVFPCGADKRPATAHGFKDACHEAGAVERIFLDAYRAHGGKLLIGIPTGRSSALSVLDVDPAGLEWLALESYRLLTCRVLTRRGGAHFWFKHRDGLRNSAGKIAPGVDVRGEGGYAIAWMPEALLRGGFAPWPQWLDDILEPSRPEIKAEIRHSAGSADGARRYADAALRRAMHTVASAPKGQRNSTLNRETFSLARLIGRGTSAHEILTCMTAAGLACGLDPREVARTIVSGLDGRAGKDG